MGKYHGRYHTWGPPGSGKTTWLTRQIDAILQATEVDGRRLQVAVCSLTRAAAAEVAGRNPVVPKHAIGTLHSFAYRALGRPEIAELHLDEWNAKHPELRLAVKGNLDDPKDEDAATDRASADATATFLRYQTARARRTPRDLWPVSLRAFAEQWEAWKHENDYFDFTDLIEEALLAQTTMPGNPRVLLVDEAQDYSRLEHDLVDMWARDAEAVMLAGDPYQCLYAWRGSDPDLFLRDDLPEDRLKVLAKSWRLPRAIRDAALAWVSQLDNFRPIHYRDRGEEGRVVRLAAPYHLRNPGLLADLIERGLEADDESTHLVCAACSYMLTPLIHELRNRGIPFANPLRPTNGRWNPLGPRSGTSLTQRLLALLAVFQHPRLWTHREMDLWAKHTRGILNRGAKKAIADLAKTMPTTPVRDEKLREWLTDDARRTILAALQVPQPWNELARWWQANLNARSRHLGEYLVKCLHRGGVKALQQRPRVWLGTIHSVKGGEADYVYLAPDLSPQGAACYTGRAGPEGRNGVIRQFYVGMTRARRGLLLLAASGHRTAVTWRCA